MSVLLVAIPVTKIEKSLEIILIVEFVEQLRNNPDKRLASFQAVFDTYDTEITSYLYPISLFRGSFDNAAAASLFAVPYEKAADSLGMLTEYSLIDFDSKTSRYSQNELVILMCSQLEFLVEIACLCYCSQRS